MICKDILFRQGDGDRSAGIHLLQADKKRVIFAGDYEGLVCNQLTCKRIKDCAA